MASRYDSALNEFGKCNVGEEDETMVGDFDQLCDGSVVFASSAGAGLNTKDDFAVICRRYIIDFAG